MDRETKAELESIQNEINGIIKELDRIADGLYHDFAGIGTQRCAILLHSYNSKYQEALKILRNI